LGTWNYAINTPEGEQTGQWIFSNDGGTLIGLMTGNAGGPDTDMNNLSFLGGTLTFDFDYDAGGQSVEVIIMGDLSEAQFTGEATIEAFNMSIPVSATKVPN
jgi:hypothetical protein